MECASEVSNCMDRDFYGNLLDNKRQKQPCMHSHFYDVVVVMRNDATDANEIRKSRQRRLWRRSCVRLLFARSCGCYERSRVALVIERFVQFILAKPFV